MSRHRHPDRYVEEALRYAEAHGWRVECAGPKAHAWGKMYCPENDSACRGGMFCITSIWGTPRNAQTHAKQITRVVDGCTAREPRWESG